jgi:hypothetical protein
LMGSKFAKEKTKGGEHKKNVNRLN